VLTFDEARRIAVNVANLPELCGDFHGAYVFSSLTLAHNLRLLWSRGQPMSKSQVHSAIDALIADSLNALAADQHVSQWWAKENNWVSYFAFRYLLRCYRADSVLRDPAQIGVEVSVPQPPGRGTRGVRRDIVIWREPGMTAWGNGWLACSHPMAILEWKVHRPGRKNKLVAKERQWLKDYCAWQPTVPGYAIEVDGTERPLMIRCSRFLGSDDQFHGSRCGVDSRRMTPAATLGAGNATNLLSCQS
jgi:hypothetical protein